METRRRFQLRTLGRIALLDASGQEDPSLSTRPRKLALLAWLALRPEQRATRDRIIGVFWGDRDEERARNSLADAISHLRRVLGRESIRTQGLELVIAKDAPLDVDALELAGAASRGSHAAVVSLYRGPFLDGFYVNDAPEFDDWRDRERSRLEGAFAKSARARCAELAAGASWDECRALAERWLDAEPASGEAGLILLRATDAPATHVAHVAALAAFENLKVRLARDLEIVPDARVSLFAKEIADRLAETPPPPTIARPMEPVSSTVATRPVRQSWHWKLAGGVTVGAVALIGAATHRSPPLDHHRVVVAAFQNRTGDSTLNGLGAVAADWVSRSLTETRVVEVADPLLVPTDSIDDPRVIGRDAQAGVVVIGTYTRQGDSLEIDARLVDANTGRVLRATPPVVAPLKQPIAAIDTLRQRVAGAMAAEVDPLIASLVREASQPPTYDAYLAWIEGLDTFAHRDRRASIKPFLRAAALDTTFVSPRIWIVAAYGNLGEYARADSIRLTLLPLRGRMAPLDRGFLDYWSATFRGDRQGQYVSSRETLAAAPGSELAIYMAGCAALFVNRPNEAAALFRRLPVEHSAVTWDVYGTRLAQALHAAGRHDEELAETTRRLEHAPGSLPAMSEHAKALIAAGRIGEAAELIKQILATRGDKSTSAGSTVFDLADELEVHGHPAEAKITYALVADWLRGLPVDKAPTRSARDLLSGALYRSNELRTADSVTRASLLVDSTSVNLTRYDGLIAARLGNIAEAERASMRLAALTTPYLFGSNTLARAEIAAVLGRREDATNLARQSLAEGLQAATLHLIPELISLRGYPSFDALIKPID